MVDAGNKSLQSKGNNPLWLFQDLELLQKEADDNVAVYCCTLKVLPKVRNTNIRIKR